jgi:hypothetical protein
MIKKKKTVRKNVIRKKVISPKAAGSKVVKSKVVKIKSKSETNLKIVDSAVNWLNTHDSEKILIKQTRNLGDTLHITPIARHYKTVNPNCKIAFIVGAAYRSVHELNPDFDKIYTVDHKLEPRDRIEIGNYMKNIKGIKTFCPSIFPFSEVWASHVWSYPEISCQYFSNAGITPPYKIQGGGKLRAPISENDQIFANGFLKSEHKYIVWSVLDLE